jgi:hypothetical protein
MFKNYFTIAFRNLWKNKVYSGINIAGMAIGLACCLTIGLFIRDELSYDRFHTHGENNWWLQDFAYRTNINWWIFVLAGSSVVLIALITVSFQSVKAALANPVKALRSE